MIFVLFDLVVSLMSTVLISSVVGFLSIYLEEPISEAMAESGMSFRVCPCVICTQV